MQNLRRIEIVVNKMEVGAGTNLCVRGLLGNDKVCYFCSADKRKAKRSHSSMDRISDSGSDDLGSSPDGITKRLRSMISTSFIY
jgi:hypothetical protein